MKDFMLRESNISLKTRMLCSVKEKPILMNVIMINLFLFFIRGVMIAYMEVEKLFSKCLEFVLGFDTWLPPSFKEHVNYYTLYSHKFGEEYLSRKNQKQKGMRGQEYANIVRSGQNGCSPTKYVSRNPKRMLGIPTYSFLSYA